MYFDNNHHQDARRPKMKKFELPNSKTLYKTRLSKYGDFALLEQANFKTHNTYYVCHKCDVFLLGSDLKIL
jgi:hypothetical protein